MISTKAQNKILRKWLKQIRVAVQGAFNTIYALCFPTETIVLKMYNDLAFVVVDVGW